MPIPQSVRDILWFREHHEGRIEAVAIARRDGVPVKSVWEGIARAWNAQGDHAGIPVADAIPEDHEHEHERGPRVGEPVLVPWFPIASLVPSSPCPHRGIENDGIRRGSRLCCMICHRSGLDHLAILKRPPIANGKKKYTGNGKAGGKGKGKSLTRKERRARFFAGKGDREDGSRPISP